MTTSFKRAGGTGLALALLTGCSLLSTRKTGPASVNELVNAVERVHVAAEVSKTRVHGAIEVLGTILSPDFDGNAQWGHQQLIDAIERSEEQAETLRDAVDVMRENASPVFEQWTTNLESFSDSEMRLRSLTRLVGSRERFDAIVTTSAPAQTALDNLNRTLRDRALFLSHDFNPTTIASLRGDAVSLVTMLEDVDAKVVALLAAAQTYVDSAAMPVTVDPPPDAPAVVRPGDGGDPSP